MHHISSPVAVYGKLKITWATCYYAFLTLNLKYKFGPFLDITSIPAITCDAWLILPSPNSLSDIHKQETNCLWSISPPFLGSYSRQRQENNASATDSMNIEIGRLLLVSFTVNWLLTFQDKPIGLLIKTGLACVAVKTRFFFPLWHASKWSVKLITRRGDISSLIAATAMCLPATRLFWTQVFFIFNHMLQGRENTTFLQRWMEK